MTGCEVVVRAPTSDDFVTLDGAHAEPPDRHWLRPAGRISDKGTGPRHSQGPKVTDRSGEGPNPIKACAVDVGP